MMGNVAWRMFASLGVAAIFEEPNELGDELDPTADRNGPAVSPEDHLDKVKFSTALDLLEVVSDTEVAISHALIAAGTANSMSGSGLDGAGSSAMSGPRLGASSATFDLVTHGLGYVPDFLVVAGDQVLSPGRPVQTQSDGRGRYCAAYATSTKIVLHEWASASSVALPAISIDYRVIVLREPRDADGSKLFDFNAATGVTKMGFDRFSSDRAYLQVVEGGSPFGIAYGKTIDLKNGAPRFVDPDGTIFEPVPSTAQIRWVISTYNLTHNGAYASIAYDGSFTGPEQILVQAP